MSDTKEPNASTDIFKQGASLPYPEAGHRMRPFAVPASIPDGPEPEPANIITPVIQEYLDFLVAQERQRCGGIVEKYRAMITETTYPITPATAETMFAEAQKRIEDGDYPFSAADTGRIEIQRREINADGESLRHV